MKQNIHLWGLLIFLLFLITFSGTSARFLASKHGKKGLQLSNINSQVSSLVDKDGIESFDKLMGMEDCGNEDDEECLSRRVAAEAHLDYIYTQHHRP